MLRRFLLAGEMKQFASFVSPAFFDVMPAKRLWQRARVLIAASRDREAFRHAMAERRALLGRSTIAVQVVGPECDEHKPASRSSRSDDPSDRGSKVVSLYFHQLLHGSTTVFDLRYASFSEEDGNLCWHPARWIATWNRSFIEGLREVYKGFYRGDDDRFRAGLRALGISHAEDAFRRHFGDGESAVRFRMKEFVDAFHEVFVACRDHGTSLHSDFLPLGLYLATLFEHLDELGVAVNVTACFERALRLSSDGASEVPDDARR